MQNKQWIIAEKKSNDIIEQVLTNRHIPKKEWTSFLNPDFAKDLWDPFLLDGIDTAVERLRKAVSDKETIGIFGDYDADGIPAAVLLSEVIEKKLRLKTLVYIPARKEGYGLNKEGIDFFKKNGVSVMFTVDLGVRENKNIEYATSLGMDVIVTDHHEPGEVLPKCLALINPKLKNSRYPFRELSGGGVVFKLMQAMSRDFDVKEADLKWAMDLVGVTTICDVVPLIGENRVFAKYGLTVLRKTRRLGLKKLYQASGIDPENIDTYIVGFQIGPRINAPGRMGGASDSFHLLKTNDENEAAKLALSLDRINRERQAKLDEIFEEAEAQIKKEKLQDKKVIILSREGWPSGVIGLVAGRLMERYSRPCIVLEKGKVFSKGSARSIENFHLVEVLENLHDLLINFGGHARAAGLTVENKNLQSLYDEMLKSAESRLTADDLVPKILVDAKLEKDDLSLGLFDKIRKLEPFGMGNPRPVFIVNDVWPENLRTIGQDGKHLKFNIGNISGIGFGMGDAIEKIQDKNVSLVFTLDEDNWGGVRKLQLKVLDVKVAQ